MYNKTFYDNRLGFYTYIFHLFKKVLFHLFILQNVSL